jgi:hypothetical protein
MNVYKLKYIDKETAIADLKAKGVYVETEEGLSYGQGVHAIVEIGKIILTNGTYDEEGNVITEPTYADGYHYDIMCEQEIAFDNAIEPNNPKHQFAGYYKETPITNEEEII